MGRLLLVKMPKEKVADVPLEIAVEAWSWVSV
jgi:hypothetical protein